MNREYDKLIQEAIQWEGTKERYETFSQAERLIVEGALVLPISHSPTINIINLEHIKGWYLNPLDLHPVKYFDFYGPRMLPNIVRR